jgi:lactoylglutathione lyase
MPDHAPWVAVATKAPSPRLDVPNGTDRLMSTRFYVKLPQFAGFAGSMPGTISRPGGLRTLDLPPVTPRRRLRPVALIHTCYRITDIDRSVAFYEALGFEEVGRIPIRDEAVNVFMNQPGDGDMPRLELTYNFGVDSYEIGTAYGHIAITSDDLDTSLARLAEQGIEPEKPPYSVREGGSRLCFVRDPDGYRVELIEQAAA